MIRELRLILLFFLGVALSCNAVIAFAATCVPIDKWATNYPTNGGTSQATYYGVTKQDACDQLPNGPWTAGDTCWQYLKPYTGAWVYRPLEKLSSLCPDNTQAINGQCTCDDKCKPMKGQEVMSGFVGPEYNRLDMSFPRNADDNYIGQQLCQNNCKAVVTKEVGSTGVGYAGRYYGTFNAKFDGSSCAVDKPDSSKTTEPEKLVPKDSDEKKCVDKGMAYGYVNDKVICVKPDDVKGNNTKKTTETNPDGTKTVVETTTTMKCDGAVCIEITTTTTTTYNPDGTVKDQKTDTKQTDKPNNGGDKPTESGFCKENPSSPLCKTGSFSGACGSEPSCSGDPVQCATAKAAFEANCKAMKPGTPPESTDPVGEKKENINFQPVSMGGGGSCPANKTVTIMGKSISFDFSMICQFAVTIKPVVIALGWLLAGYIVFGYRGKGS